MNIDRVVLQAAVRRACELDVAALKPGNVSVDSPAYGMTAADFIASAEAIVAPITALGSALGERVYRAIEATQKVVSCNTNLGIVLLLAPLIHAVESSNAHESIETALINVLDRLTVADAEWAYRAIRLAKPGGMGKTSQYDIADTPSVTLFQAMQEASERDQIARLYTTGYRTLFHHALPVWRAHVARARSPQWAATAVFLSLLANEPDSLITRKFGSAESQQVSNTAKTLWQSLQYADDPIALRPALMNWDAQLKEKKLNPGTTADMTVATIFLADLQDIR